MIAASMMTKLFHRFASVFLFSVMLVIVPAQEPGPIAPNGRDVLVYKDGDRVLGKLVEQTAATIVFFSERFGTLRVPASDAVVIKSSVSPAKPPIPPAAAGMAKVKSGKSPAGARPAAVAGNVETAAERAEVEKVSRWEWFSPALLTAKLANFFGPWHGKVAFSDEVVSDTSDRDNVSLEGTLQRKWAADEVQLKGQYDYSKTNDLTTTDLLKGDGLWRHTFPENRFAIYHPSFEWNRANLSTSPLVPGGDYFLLQQEIGVGLSIWSTPIRKVRIGVSENLFDLWSQDPVPSHNSRAVESAFVESEFKLPWRMSLTQRAVYYYSIASGDTGWESTVELSKKFTETFSTSIRHEIRRNNPDGRAPDYTRLKLLFGIDF
jgi:hypothetical protein